MGYLKAHTATGQRAIAALLLLAALTALLAGCGPVEIGIERPGSPAPGPVGSGGTGAAPTQTPTPTATRSPDLPAVERVRVYLIAIDDGGRMGKEVGCGDSIVPVEREIPPTQEPLRAALDELLSMHDRYYGQSGLYNALHRSDLRVDSATIEGGRALIHLSGELNLSGICDEPRARAQLEETASQFAAEVVLYFH